MSRNERTAPQERVAVDPAQELEGKLSAMNEADFDMAVLDRYLAEKEKRETVPVRFTTAGAFFDFCQSNPDFRKEKEGWEKQNSTASR